MELLPLWNHCRPSSAPLVKLTCEVSPGGRFLELNTTPPTAATYGDTLHPPVKFHLAMKGLMAPAYCAPWIQNSFSGIISTAISKLPRRALCPSSCVSTRPMRPPMRKLCALGVAAKDWLPPMNSPLFHPGCLSTSTGLSVGTCANSEAEARRLKRTKRMAVFMGCEGKRKTYQVATTGANHWCCRELCGWHSSQPALQ